MFQWFIRSSEFDEFTEYLFHLGEFYTQSLLTYMSVVAAELNSNSNKKLKLKLKGSESIPLADNFSCISFGTISFSPSGIGEFTLLEKLIKITHVSWTVNSD